MLAQEVMTVVEQVQIAPRIFSLVLEGKLVQEMQAGQFVHIRVPDKSMLLRRPISISDIDKEMCRCRLIYRTEGQGTELLSLLQAGQELDVMGPLGNGFPTEFLTEGNRILIVGGGIGVPPLVELAKQAKRKGAEVFSILGFANRDALILEDELSQYGEVLVTTDDGSYGQKGHIGHIIEELETEFKAIYACGAPGMMAYLDQKFQHHPHAYLSLESRMACGMGACYACVVKEKGGQDHENKRVCKEGPVFKTGSLVL